jgi:hypothetical protein
MQGDPILVGEVHLVHHEAGDLAEPAAGVDQQPKDRLGPGGGRTSSTCVSRSGRADA